MNVQEKRLRSKADTPGDKESRGSKINRMGGITMVPETFEEIDLGMSNFDHEIDNGFEEALVGKQHSGRHAGWNFNGVVYHKDGQFHEDVWEYGEFIETISTNTLKELMESVNDKYEWS